LSLLASALLSALFDCVTEPPPPGLSTRTGAFVFDAPVCVAAERAAAACSLPADCVAVCTPVDPAPQHAGEVPLACACEALWSDEFAFDAFALLSTLFDCETEPSFPGLRTRIPTLVLLGWFCTAPDAAPAAWVLVADWSATCTPVDGVFAAATPVMEDRANTHTVSAIIDRFI
jgi:hypothetical protein